jgi:uncharacterized protein
LSAAGDYGAARFRRPGAYRASRVAPVGAAAMALFVFFLFPFFAVAETALEPLEIVTASGAHGFEVEVARSAREREVGLMYRRALPTERGMLFIFPKEQIIYMWMKNTYLPLDMVFVSRSGRVVGVKRDAAPMSEELITSGPPAYAVIELNAGVAKAIGVATGDSVRHPGFGR